MLNDIPVTPAWMGRLRSVLRRPLSPVLRWWFHTHYTRPRRWRRHGMDITILPGVFPPGPTVSTTVLLDYLRGRLTGQGVSGRRVLDMGCGTGLIGLLLARAGAFVVATDINPAAIDNARLNAARNGLDLAVAAMDQTGGFRLDAFDLILITPPYYPRRPGNMAERAWFCGEDFGYFTSLAPQLAAMDLDHTEILMVLSEDCDLAAIAAILAWSGLRFQLTHARRLYLEMTLVLRVVPAEVSGRA